MSKRRATNPLLSEALAQRGRLEDNASVPSLVPGLSGSREIRINMAQMELLEKLYWGNCVTQATRTVLHSQILGGGLHLKRNGNIISQGADFASHIEEYWLPCARDVLDMLICHGIAVVSFDKTESFASGLDSNKESAPFGIGNARSEQAYRRSAMKANDIVPIVPALSTYDIAFTYAGAMGYSPKWKIYSREMGMQEDNIAKVFVKQLPDSLGNVRSQISAVFDSKKFVDSMTHYALVAETARAQPAIVTQQRKVANAATVTPQDMYFDTSGEMESRNQQQRDNENRMAELTQMRMMAQMVNTIQTRIPEDQMSSASKSLRSDATAARIQSQTQARVFPLPIEHEVANPQMPESRNDLVDIWRLNIDEMCATMGVPASLVFDSQHGSSNTSQHHLDLLNGTVKELAKIVDSVLTWAWDTIYGSVSLNGSVQMVTSSTPVAASQDVISAYSSGIIGTQEATPIIMRALGFPQSAIDATLDRHIKKEEEDKKKELEDRQMMKEAHKKAMAAPTATSAKPATTATSSRNNSSN